LSKDKIKRQNLIKHIIESEKDFCPTVCNEENIEKEQKIEEKQEIILSEEEEIIDEINSLNSKNNNDEIIDKVLKLCKL